mmetsp:Transcript_15564/g.39057  ORF Transcript_15564/g.39057 Transcript_15564/m.39057 type:complete len:158 (-) Transcript_15564:2-475(-)
MFGMNMSAWMNVGWSSAMASRSTLPSSVRRLVADNPRLFSRVTTAREREVWRAVSGCGTRGEIGGVWVTLFALLEPAAVAFQARELMVPLVREDGVALDDSLHLPAPGGLLSASVEHVGHCGHVDGSAAPLAGEVFAGLLPRHALKESWHHARLMIS